MSKNMEIEKLLSDNIHERLVVYDGIVDEETFYKPGGLKILYLLKDVNATMSSKQSIDYENNPSFISITKERALAQKDKPLNWKPLCYWTEAFKNPKISFVDADSCGKNLLDISIVNLKKTPGAGTADGNELMDAAEKYGHILQKEIEIISPSYVICGGTYNDAKMIYKELCDFSEEHQMNVGAKYFTTKKGIKFVEFVHPSVRVTLAVTYAYAKELGIELGMANNFNLT